MSNGSWHPGTKGQTPSLADVLAGADEAPEQVGRETYIARVGATQRFQSQLKSAGVVVSSETGHPFTSNE